MARTGRRPGDGGTREAILDAATEVFTQFGYDGASMRRIADRAGVDVALIYHYFKGKQDVFVASMRLPFNPGVIVVGTLTGDPEGAGERLIDLVLEIWDGDPDRNPFLAVLRTAVTNEQTAVLVRQFFTDTIIKQVVANVPVSHPALRANLIASQVAGLAILRYVIRIEPLASMTRGQLVAAYGPTLQRYLTGDVTGPSTTQSAVQGVVP